MFNLWFVLNVFLAMHRTPPLTIRIIDIMPDTVPGNMVFQIIHVGTINSKSLHEGWLNA
jgi:hypothetical protein